MIKNRREENHQKQNHKDDPQNKEARRSFIPTYDNTNREEAKRMLSKKKQLVDWFNTTCARHVNYIVSYSNKLM